jgi:two-component sensor histidine kinase
MFQTLPRHVSRMAVPVMSRAEPTEDAVAMRQLRHQTKNALQRIIAQLDKTELRDTPAGAALADEIERRIFLTARISDALFGLTECPGPLQSRLTSLCDGVVALMTDIEQTIQTEVSVNGACHPGYEQTVIQVAHEMVANAVKHGMHMRLVGRIDVHFRAGRPDGSAILTVSDDGWGPAPGTEGGDGLPIMRALAERHGGTVSLDRQNGLTIARLCLPGVG